MTSIAVSTVPDRRLRSLAVPAGVDVLLVVIVSAVVYALHGFEAGLSRDLGVFVYGGEHVARGVPPYVDIFNTVGPLADAVPGLAIWTGGLVGLDPILSARLLFMVLSVACCALVYVLGRDVFSSRLAGLTAAAVFLTFQDFIELASDGPREKTTMVLFLVAALMMVQRRRWFSAGVCTGLATLVWQPALAVAATAVVVAVLVSRVDRVRSLARFVAGGLVPSLATLVVLGATGALSQAWAGFVTVNVFYTRQPSAWSAPAFTIGFLWHGYHLSLVVFAAGLLALLGSGTAALRRRPPGPEVALAAAAVVGLAWTMLAINGPPDLFELLPLAALGIAGALVTAVRRLPAVAAVSVVALTCTASVGLAVVESVGSANDRLDQQRADIAAVLAAVPSGAEVLSINAPEVLAISGGSNPTAYQVFDGAIDRYLGHTTVGGVDGYAALVARLRPTVLVVGHGDVSRWPISLLDEDYRRAGSYSSWTWYVSRSSGPATWEAVRAANQSVVEPASA
ncbi:MAG: DolP-mannose mannosyltransferase [Nocardioides sp.]